MSLVIDADQHLYERPDMWRTYCDPDKRHLAVSIEPDELGYWWLTVPGKGRFAIVTIPTPGGGFANSDGTPRERQRQGLPSQVDYLRDLPEDYWNPSARVARLDEWGIDRALTFYNFQMGWPRAIPKSRVDIFRANIEAWNRWAVEIRQTTNARLEPVGQITFRGGDLSWAVEQIEFLAANGIRGLNFTYGLIDGRRPAHPDHDRVWAAMADHGMVMVLHTQDSDEHPSSLPRGWFEHDDSIPVIDLVFANVGIAAYISDLIIGGVFDRFPSLKVFTVENTAGWLLPLLGTPSPEGDDRPRVGTGTFAGASASPNGTSLDTAYRVRNALAGRPLVDLKMRPSEYLRKHVRATITTAEPVNTFFEWGMEDMIMFGGDYPHAEGLARPLPDFEAAVGPLSAVRREKVLGGNAAAALGIS